MKYKNPCIALINCAFIFIGSYIYAAPNVSDFGKGDNEAIQQQAASSSPLVGTWVMSTHRHELVITFKSDGTYKCEADGNKTRGTWKLIGNQLFQKQNGNNSMRASTAAFDNINSFIMGAALRYDRVIR
jgi:hypothetical protein